MSAVPTRKLYVVSLLRGPDLAILFLHSVRMGGARYGTTNRAALADKFTSLEEARAVARDARKAHAALRGEGRFQFSTCEYVGGFVFAEDIPLAPSQQDPST